MRVKRKFLDERVLDEPPIIRGLRFEGDNPGESDRKWAVEGGVACVDRLDVVEEGEKRDSVAEGAVGDYGKVVFVGGYETEVDWEAAKRIVWIEIRTVNKIFRGVIDATSSSQPTRSRERNIQLGPNDREVERRPHCLCQDFQLFSALLPGVGVCMAAGFEREDLHKIILRMVGLKRGTSEYQMHSRDPR